MEDVSDEEDELTESLMESQYAPSTKHKKSNKLLVIESDEEDESEPNERDGESDVHSIVRLESDEEIVPLKGKKQVIESLVESDEEIVTVKGKKQLIESLVESDEEVVSVKGKKQLIESLVESDGEEIIPMDAKKPLRKLMAETSLDSEVQEDFKKSGEHEFISRGECFVTFIIC